MKDIFEGCFFNNIKRGIKKNKHTAFSSETINFEKEVNKNFLKFEGLLKKDIKAHITYIGDHYNVKLSKPHLAYNMVNILSEHNPELKFTEDLLGYEPDEDLIMKSKFPLWIIKSIGVNSVSIKRIW